MTYLYSVSVPFLDSFAIEIITEAQAKLHLLNIRSFLSILDATDFCVYMEGRKEIILLDYLLYLQISVYM